MKGEKIAKNSEDTNSTIVVEKMKMIGKNKKRFLDNLIWVFLTF